MSENSARLLESTTDERKSKRWRVQQWTAFPFEDDADRKIRKDREENLDRVAETLTTRLRVRCPHYEPGVSRVRIDHKPQLLFDLTVPARDEKDALRRARYWMKRSLEWTRKVKVAGRMRPISLDLPMGKVQVEEVA